MKIRDYTINGMINWPPVWTATGRYPKHLAGEVGVLTDAYSNNAAESTIFLLMRYDDQKYIGALFFKDCAGCTRILSLLQAHVGRSIEEIGDLDL